MAAAAAAAALPIAARSLLLLLLALQILVLALPPSIIPLLTPPSLLPRRLPPPPPPPPLRSTSSHCNGSRIYIYDLPPQFNTHLVQNCSSISPAWSSICPALSNHGLGESFPDAPWPPSHAWYATDQFAIELIFHSRMHRHPCTTHDPNLATAFFVPFYAGLAVYKHLFIPDAIQERDELCREMLQWLSVQAPYRKNDGRDHFFVIGRITWDFRRSDAAGWGSSFLNMPAMRNTAKLVIERSPWDEQEIGIPYPTSFHPTHEQDVQQWQDYVKSKGKHRPLLFGYAGGPRKQQSSDIRQLLLRQCEDSGGSCKALDCSHGACLHPRPVIELFLDSKFCLQPPGDSSTRRSTFDCMVAGGIPVFFSEQSAYLQYSSHLPSDPSSYSVFIPEEIVKNGSSGGRIEQILREISEEKLRAMQSKVVDLIPSIVYANPQNSLTRTSDALDLAIIAVLSRIKAKLSSSSSSGSS